MATTRLPNRMKATLAALALALGAACDNPAASEGGGGNPTPTPTPQPAAVVSVQVAPDTATLLALGGHRMLSSTVRVTGGQVDNLRYVTWTSSNPAVAVVDASGNVTGLTVGETVITAASEGKQGQARVRVIAVTVDSVAFPAAWYVVQWDTQKGLYPTLYAADGRVLWDRAISWSSSDPDVASVDAYGNVRGVHGGRAWITATSEGRSARAEIIVPDTKVMALAQANGKPLSAAVVDSIQVRGDTLVRVRVVATQGTLTFDTRSETYEQRVTLQTYERRGSRTLGDQIWELGERLVKQETVTDRGIVRRNQFTGEPIFVSSLQQGLMYYAQSAPNDAFTVWQVLPGTGAHLPWLYRL